MTVYVIKLYTNEMLMLFVSLAFHSYLTPFP